MFIRLTGLIGVSVAVVAIVTTLPASAQNYTPEQQQLCSGDAFRLCGSEIPDVDRVTACMVRRRAQLSPGCQSVFRYQPVAAPVPARTERPMNIRPKAGKASKVVKARKMKKSS